MLNKRLICFFIIIATYYTGIFAFNNAVDVNIMECRNFVTAREILENHSWLIPTMNGRLRITKPPLPTWLTAISMKIAGTDDNIAFNRIPAGFMAVVLIGFFLLFVRSIANNRRVSLIASLILSTSYIFMCLARQCSWDIFCHSFMMGSISFLTMGLMKENPSIWYFVLSGIMGGLSFMSKGPVAFYSMLLPFLLSFIVSFGFSAFRGKRRKIFVAILVCIIMSSLWPLYLYLNIPYESIKIAHQEVYAWSHRHTRPLWYYAMFPAVSGIWLFLLLPLLIPGFAKKRVTEIVPYRFLIMWIIFTVLLLSFIPEKKDRYLFPVIIPVSILIASYIEYIFLHIEKLSKVDKKIFILQIIMIILCAISIPGVFIYSLISFHEFSLLMLFMVMTSLVFTFYLIKSIKKNDFYKGFLYSLVILVLAINTVTPVVRKIVPLSDFMSFRVVRTDPLLNKFDFYSIDNPNIKIVWISGKKITHISSINDLPEKRSALVSRYPVDFTRIKRKPIKTIKIGGKKKKREWYLYLFEPERRS